MIATRTMLIWKLFLFIVKLLTTILTVLQIVVFSLINWPSGGKSNIGLNQTPPPSAQPGQSSSCKKLSSSKLPKDYTYDIYNVNIIGNVPILSSLVRGFTRCKTCSTTD